MSNYRFQEYATSGAFTLGLTRNQVATLDMIERGAHGHVGGWTAALERKGLVETVAAPTADEPDRREYRLTRAGLLTLALVREAGLTNAGPDPVATELATLKAECEARRQEAADARRAGRSAMARLEHAEHALRNEKAMRRGDKPAVRILLRDPTPEFSDADLRAQLQDDAAMEGASRD